MPQLKINMAAPGHWVVNVFHDWENPDPDYELVSPNPSVNVDINTTPTYVTLYVSAAPGTLFSLELGTTVIIRGTTKSNGLFMGHARVK